MGLKNNKNMQTCVSLFFFVFFTELVVCSLDMFQAFFLLLTLLQPILLQELQVLSVGPVWLESLLAEEDVEGLEITGIPVTHSSNINIA